MTKAERSLKILVAHTLSEDAIWADLRKKGHTVDVAYSDSAHTIMSYDLVFGPNCWQLYPTLTKYVPAAISAARKRRKDTKNAV